MQQILGPNLRQQMQGANATGFVDKSCHKIAHALHVEAKFFATSVNFTVSVHHECMEPGRSRSEIVGINHRLMGA